MAHSASSPPTRACWSADRPSAHPRPCPRLGSRSGGSARGRSASRRRLDAALGFLRYHNLIAIWCGAGHGRQMWETPVVNIQNSVPGQVCARDTGASRVKRWRVRCFNVGEASRGSRHGQIGRRECEGGGEIAFKDGGVWEVYQRLNLMDGIRVQDTRDSVFDGGVDEQGRIHGQVFSGTEYVEIENRDGEEVQEKTVDQAKTGRWLVWV
ncbi:hypothetical protein FIBSPDRAFT_95520 [Athelia psychrophila]|uniref:Uncharacterized protein n=1 Tax=Athelia psychrophila TaxID=1759441 RepID=A0A166DS40_9AGAM|nr:hypothetical protein FIBSPDRAFT_95520 [Fibularhizoctonia sp. CBS 109695]